MKFRVLAAIAALAGVVAVPAFATDTILSGGRKFSSPGQIPGCRPTSALAQPDGGVVELTPCSVDANGAPTMIMVRFHPIDETTPQAYLEGTSARFLGPGREPVTFETYRFETRGESGDFLCWSTERTARGTSVAECALLEPSVRIVVTTTGGDAAAAMVTMRKAIGVMRLR